MKWRSTLFLVALVAALLAFIVLVERHTVPAGQGRVLTRILTDVLAGEVTQVRVHRTNQFMVDVSRAPNGWAISDPIAYAAEPFAVEGLLQTLENLPASTYITAQELTGKTNSDAEFGLDVPVAALTLMQRGHRKELRFGHRTPAGDSVYMRIAGDPGIYVVDSQLLNRIPSSLNDWRNRLLINFQDLVFDRFSIATGGRGFTVQSDAATKTFFISKPLVARADHPKVVALLQALHAGRVKEFVSDNPSADLEPLGLQPPEIEFRISKGTNDLVIVGFGKSPSHDPSLIYARRMSQTNIVLVPKELADSLRLTHTDLRDRLVLSFDPLAVTAISVAGLEPFIVGRQPDGQWRVDGQAAWAADTAYVWEVLSILRDLSIVEFVKDVVTDFSSYKLAPPSRQYALLGSNTNAQGVVSNSVLSQLELGAQQGEKVYVRRSDENSVYALEAREVAALPIVSWQFRDRRVWRFTTNEVKRVTIQHLGRTRQMLRSPNGTWSLAPGSAGIINTFAIEEVMHRLGELTAGEWSGRGDGIRNRLGFGTDGHQLQIEVSRGDKTETLHLEFGGVAPSHYVFARTLLEGEPWFFEFPIGLYVHVDRDLKIPGGATSNAVN